MADSTSLNTITINGQTYTAADYASQQTQKAKDGSTLDKDAFLQLLVTQMRYQDPLDPQDNAEYVAQLAQFSALEQMTNVAETATAISKLVNNIDTSVLVGQLSGMIGKDIQWTTEVTEKDASGKSVTSKQTYEGVVTGVSVTDGAPSIIANVNGKSMQVSVGDITRVGKVAEAQG